MKPGYARSAGYNREKLLLHDDSSVGKLLSTSALFLLITCMAHGRTQGLFLQDEEDRIQKLKIFGQVVELSYAVSSRHTESPLQRSVSTHVVQRYQWPGPSTISTDGEEYTLLPNGWSQLLNEKYQQGARDGRQEEIVDEEQIVKFECRTRSHQLSTSENDCII